MRAEKSTALGRPGDCLGELRACTSSHQSTDSPRAGHPAFFLLHRLGHVVFFHVAQARKKKQDKKGGWLVLRSGARGKQMHVSAVKSRCQAGDAGAGGRPIDESRHITHQPVKPKDDAQDPSSPAASSKRGKRHAALSTLKNPQSQCQLAYSVSVTRRRKRVTRPQQAMIPSRGASNRFRHLPHHATGASASSNSETPKEKEG